ncbi:unnamed protein product [Calypogeia fissa]
MTDGASTKRSPGAKLKVVVLVPKSGHRPNINAKWRATLSAAGYFTGPTAGESRCRSRYITLDLVGKVSQAAVIRAMPERGVEPTIDGGAFNPRGFVCVAMVVAVRDYGVHGAVL